MDHITYLRKVFIRNCNLTTLYVLTKMKILSVSFNRLQDDVDVGKWVKLEQTHLMYNDISLSKCSVE